MLSGASRALLILLAAALCATAALGQGSSAPDATQNKVVGKVAVKPKTLKFGKVTHTVILQFNIQNTGTAPISGSIVSNSNTPFTILSGSSSFGPVNPTSAYAVIVQFAPNKKGSYASALTIVSNAKNARVKVTMSGSADDGVATPTPTFSPTPTPTPSATPSPTATATPISTPSLGLSGAVIGPDPITGAQVTAWAIGTSGYGQGATALACVTTDANGNFAFGTSPGCNGTLPAGFLCSATGEQIYLIATGGTSGSQTAANPQIALLSALGSCSAISASTAVNINELSTIVSAYALAQFQSPAAPYAIGAPSTNSAGLNHALATITNLIDPSDGQMPGPNLPSGVTLPTAKINTLAAAIAVCVASTGSLTGVPSPCNELICDALPGAIYNSSDGSCVTPAGGTEPVDTLGATIAIAAHPGTVNVADLCTLATAEAAAFPPTIACNPSSSPPSPSDWTLALNFTAGGLNSPRAIAIDAPGNVWIANEYSVSGSGSITEYSPTGVLLSPSQGFSDISLDHPIALAIDASANLWIANAIGNSLSEIDANGDLIPGAPYIGGGLNEPWALALDSTGDVWAANNAASGNISEFAPSGAPLSPVAGYSGNGLVWARGLVIDAADHVWVIITPYSGPLQNLSDLAELNLTGTLISPAGGFTGGGLHASTAIALDPSGNLWVANQFDGAGGNGSLSKFNSSGIPLSPNNGFAGGGLDAPAGLAIDGDGDVWAANNLSPSGAGNSISEFNSSGVPLSPGSGYTGGGLNGPLAIAIDAAGNLWVINNTNTNSSVTEFIGTAAPVTTPLLGPPQKP
jgi:hypothetical protein